MKYTDEIVENFLNSKERWVKYLCIIIEIPIPEYKKYPNKINKIAIIAQNLPRTMSSIETGAVVKSVMVWLRRSSAIRRIARSGTANSSIAAVAENVGAATNSVKPGGLGNFSNCGWISRKSSNRLRKPYPAMSCTKVSTTHAMGEVNNDFKSLAAMVKITVELRLA